MKQNLSNSTGPKKRARNSNHNIRRIAIVSLCLALAGVGINLLADKSWLAAAAAQKISTGGEVLWQEIDERSISGTGERVTIPVAYKTFRLDRNLLAALLALAPKELSRASSLAQTIITLPMPDGKLARFSIEESPIMEPGLAAQFPQIKTYRGQGIDDPTATTRFDVTPAGFHAIVLSAGNSVYVDPYAKGDTANYISYYKRDVRKEGASFQCFFDEANKDAPASPSLPVPYVSNAGTLRTYRLALAATREYTTAAGGTVPDAMARMTTTMNRVNGIYERDLSIRMVMVANNSAIVFTAEPDGYSNTNGFAMLSENQTKLDLVIGNANYDIGHVFSTGGGGVASLNVPCATGSKARGVTGLSNPVGDVFAVDYVAHEMGHQFGGRHTFNGSQGSCGGNGGSSAAYEPGSGSTIMAYAGICSSQDLQLNSNDYFHVKSLEEIIAFMTTSGNCAAQASTGNIQPTVNAGTDFTIPKGTPFTLTATGSDANGDALTFCWEEYDLGPSSPPDNDADGFARPIFRSYNPTSSTARIFPSLAYILGNASNPPSSYSCPNGPGSCTTGEVLPSITRTMSFQVTARDNRAAGGGVNTDTMVVSVSAASGPFVITQPDSAVTWDGGTSQTINWNVANTTAGPVNCANVKISLSTDGGNTFPIVIAASTPNDGTQSITVPSAATTQGRIKVEAVGNIFFDISNANFTINAPCGFSATPSSQFFPAAGGQGSVTVATGASCTWAAASNSDWIVLTSSGSGSGNNPVTFEVRENFTASARQGSLTVAGVTINIFQNAAQGVSCNYTISPGFASFSVGSGSASVTVTTAGSCAWEAASETEWITITSGAAGVGNGAVGYSVAANATGKARKGSIRIAGKSFAVKQSG